jgi:hypothetical protein
MLIFRRLLAAGLIAGGLYLIYEPVSAGAVAFWFWTGARGLEPNWPWIGIGLLMATAGAALIFAGACLWSGRLLSTRPRPQTA